MIAIGETENRILWQLNKFTLEFNLEAYKLGVIEWRTGKNSTKKNTLALLDTVHLFFLFARILAMNSEEINTLRFIVAQASATNVKIGRKVLMQTNRTKLSWASSFALTVRNYITNEI